jgi:transposase-like protein
MPVSSQKKRITQIPEASSLEPSTPMLPRKPEFHQYLCTLAQSAVRTVIEAVMREELDAFIGAAWAEATATVTTPVIWSHPLVGLRISKSPEIAEDEEHLLTFYAFPEAMHRHIQTTNAIESLFSNVRQRTDQIDVFTTETSCLSIVLATMQDIRLHKISLQ